ncbi:MAG: sodium-translocating pyrophosphatase [Candidatus Thermoplasmatota archaeon]|jgi:K(+)-stimulated pyrophosphate-energized sodium pump|nr:sodium-translocating pyrophosphatase [Candidatus Thermoplasmatota archaeon]
MTLPLPIVELFVFLAALLALGVAGYQTYRVFREDEGTDKMKEISKAIREGAEAFLTREYKTVAMVGAVIAVLILVGLYNIGVSQGDTFFSAHMALGFVVGAVGSALAGYVGMYVSVRANVRTANVARVEGKAESDPEKKAAAHERGLDAAMRFAFMSGSVTGLSVAGFALLGLVAFFVGFNGNVLEMAGFIFGASLMSLFARVGGGIYTKGADVGADLVGKVEAGIPEDDPRNPAVIADNVGDNVGDCAGMAADLFETYVVTAVSTMLLAFLLTDVKNALAWAIVFPLIISAWSIVATIVAFPFVRIRKGGSIMGGLYNGLIVTVVVGLIGLGVLSYVFMTEVWGAVFVASATGLFVMLAIVYSTDFYTGTGRRPVTSISEAAQRGAGPVVIEGMSVGLEAVLIPALSIVAGIIAAYGVMYLYAPVGTDPGHFGLYGIGLAAASMLSATGMIISIDAFGPITDNAGGIAEMAQLPPEARKITDPLDAVGNTTKAVTKGYAVGSAALAALVLFAAYYQAAFPNAPASQLQALAVNQPLVIIGLIIGATLPFFFTAFLMRAVGTAAQAVVEEVRRQFRTIKGIMEGTARPEYGPCVDIVTKTAISELVLPAAIAVVTPLAVGFLLGPTAVAGLLFGVILSGLPLAIFMTVGGGAWDNGKKYIELGNFGGKGSDAHKAAVVGDTVGDATKDTAGPAINPLIKVVNTISILFVYLVVANNLVGYLATLHL